MRSKISRFDKLPIIVHSAVAHYNSENKALAGCYFLRKPAELDVVEKTINKALKGEAA